VHSARVLAAQEFVDLDAKALLREATDMHVARRRECQARLGAAIARKHGGVSYVAVRAEQMVGVLLLVFVRPQLAAEIKHLHVDTVKTGFGGNAGNKGGVAVRVRVGTAELCFINSHLAAGSKHCEERNNDHAEILRGLAESFDGARAGPFPPPCAHDLLVWLGDLNYRLEGVSNDEVRATIARGQWARLVAHDQLRKQRAAAGAFVGFEEAPLTFAPTYKYDAGTNTCASPPARTHASSAPSARGGSLQSHAALQPAHPWRLQPCAPGAAPLAGTTRPRSSACPRGRTACYGAASRPPA
jgi:synaptojanin